MHHVSVGIAFDGVEGVVGSFQFDTAIAEQGLELGQAINVGVHLMRGELFTEAMHGE